MLAYERLAPARFGDVVAEHRIIPSGTAVNDLTFFVQERGEHLQLGLEYRGDAVDAAQAQRLLDAFCDALDAVCKRPNRTVGDIRPVEADLVGPELLAVDATPLHSILGHARTDPDRTAIVESSGVVTSYGELLGRAATIAAALGADGGAPARVGVSLRRSAALIEAILGVQLAGAAYVPIDPATPPERRRAMIELAGLDVVLVDRTTERGFTDIDTVDIDTVGIDTVDAETLEGIDDASTRLQTAHAAGLPEGDRPAYVIFTSGSTGEPAAVEVTHANLAASLAARPVFYGPAAPERFLLTPSIGFDSSMVGIYWPLVSGGAIVLPDDDGVRDVDRLASLIAAQDVSHLLMVPSLYRALLARGHDHLVGLRTVVVAGEACPPDLVVEHHRRLPRVELVNEYGPTEATVWATAHRCLPDEDPVPIGTPVAGCRIRIADDRQRPLAPGAPGELLIAGPGVVGGYVAGRSDSDFVEVDGHRWYRTGDLARVDTEGRLVFLGRVDDQLNVGGQRVEPAEIERHLLRLSGVRDAVVVAATIDGRQALVAHLVADRDLVDGTSVRHHLADHVTAVPRRIVFHDELPRTSNGKLDRRRAARLDAGGAVGTGASRLVEIWRRALQRDDLGGDADFFASGGDSLAAVEIVSAVGELTGADITVSTLLVAPTPDALAARLGLAADAADGDGLTAVEGLGVLTMRVGTRSGPTVVMTPAWDSVMGYRALADAFDDDVTVLAVTPLEGAAARPDVESLGEPSADVVASELARRGTSSVTVVGWSIGGVAAYDLGQRLRSRGLDVSAVALVDTVFPGEHRHLWSNRWWKYKSLLAHGAIGSVAEEFAVAANRRGRKLVGRLGRRLLSIAGEPVPASPSTTASGVPLSALDHTPGPTTVPVVLYAATTTNPARTEHRWRTVAPELRVVPIEGRHRGFDSVMGADRVHQIVDDLTANVLSIGDPR
jgi:amino acid adenylation domain-containing protein